MEISTSHRLSFGQRVSSRGSAQQSRSARQHSIQVEPRASLRPRVSAFLVQAAGKSRFKVVAGPAGPVSCSSLPQGGQLHRFEPSGRVSRRSSAAQAPTSGFVQLASGWYFLWASMSESAVSWHFHRCAAWSHRRPNPSVKGTSRKRAAPYVER